MCRYCEKENETQEHIYQRKDGNPKILNWKMFQSMEKSLVEVAEKKFK